MSTIRFNTVAILNAVPTRELNTTRQLESDLHDLTYAQPEMNVQLYPADSLDSLSRAIARLREGLSTSSLVPVIHLEGHGLTDHSGFKLGNGTPCTWQVLKELITPLNVDMHLGLFVVLSTCYGGTFIKVITPLDRAPVWAILGPVASELAYHLQVVFTTFYRTLFETRSGGEAVKALNAVSRHGEFIMETAEDFFVKVWRTYKSEHCVSHRLDERAREVYRERRRQGLPRGPSVGKIKRTFKVLEPTQFNKFRDNYFMYDLYRENRQRFPITYKGVEKR